MMKVFDPKRFERLESYLEEEAWQPDVLDELWSQMEGCGEFTHALLVYLLDAAIRAGHVTICANMDVYDEEGENVLDMWADAPQNQHDFYDPNPVGLQLMVYCEPREKNLRVLKKHDWTTGGAIVFIDAIEEKRPQFAVDQERSKHGWIS